MKHGDFTALAKYYVDRPGYSVALLEYVKAYLQKTKGADIVTADVGAGTGKLTENLEQIGCRGYAVEPNDAMRQEGEKLFQERFSKYLHYPWTAAFTLQFNFNFSVTTLVADQIQIF